MAVENPDTEQPYYPDWLRDAYFDSAFDWEAGSQTTMARFLELYTLHDSIWIDLRLDTQYDGGATLVFRFDAFWTEGRVPHPGSVIAEWPVLLMRLRQVSSVKLMDYGIDASAQRIVGSTQTVAMGDGSSRTTIQGVYDEVVEITHAEEVELLCMARDGTVLPLTDL